MRHVRLHVGAETEAGPTVPGPRSGFTLALPRPLRGEWAFWDYERVCIIWFNPEVRMSLAWQLFLAFALWFPQQSPSPSPPRLCLPGEQWWRRFSCCAAGVICRRWLTSQRRSQEEGQQSRAEAGMHWLWQTPPLLSVEGWWRTSVFARASNSFRQLLWVWINKAPQGQHEALCRRPPQSPWTE